VLLLLASPFAIWKLPQWYAASWDKLDPKDIAKMESDTRTAMVQALGGIALLTGLWVTWRNLRLTEQTSRQTLDLSRKGQINDRFIKAIEQLGAIDQGGGKKLEIRLGGIYALEQIAKDSPDDHHWPIMEILTAYVRAHAPRKEEEHNTNMARTSCTSVGSEADSPESILRP
jgi:ABC-type nickel/cobalt efflux system permease component RcnA